MFTRIGKAKKSIYYYLYTSVLKEAITFAERV
jgi:hypothetical protein